MPTMITIVTPTPEHIKPARPGEQREPVAPVDRTVVIREQQLREAEHERSDERDLERDQDVLRTRTEEHEHARRRASPSTAARPPGASPRAAAAPRSRCKTITRSWYGT